MIQESTICPYTGLRPFTEEESLYFKGRDEHIDQATKQLEKNKFIMLTGASGDGKSSLVYAGIIPNAKAGFLKSQFSNWAVADFRPERNPLGNLCHALAKQLGIASESTVRTELSHGFSALADMYKASPLFADTTDADWGALNDNQKTIRKRQAANLIVIADQFEEFFTNPENFHKGVPSQEASLVTNLLLETARIALEEKLPIYVIITMRSDFIGQCASFRGLPEAIGFSQFFVPRLNRSQLQEVIEEPAVLSGNRISRRLTERLIHDMVEGTDQLPILQHALNQIWKMADEGKAEMDLLHYAMVGGMKGEDLPRENRKNFQEWFHQLPAKIQACYDQPDLQNVLNTHANKLYTFASDYLKNQYKEEISEADSRLIIESTFRCLTKIDNSRAVRNRMTLGEITAILNQPHLDYNKVGKELNIFREPGNTLLRPFLEEVPELQENSVLDITHESLIRNWENLDEWAKEEFNSYTIYLDFNQQLNRWIDSGKSNSFLLYIGPLTYFENWFNKVKPNVAWIARYLGEEMDHEEKYEKAAIILNNAKEFLQRSASKHAVTRTIMKYGARRIAALLGLVAFLLLSSFAFRTYLGRRNPAVLENLKDQSILLLNNPKVRFADRAAVVAEQLRTKMTTVSEVIGNIKDPLEKITMANGIAVTLIFQGRTQPAREIEQAIAMTDSLLEKFEVPYSNTKQLSAHLNNVNEWRTTLGLAYFYNPGDYLMELQKRNARRSAVAVINILEKQPRDFKDILNFTLALETALNFKAFSPEELDKVIATLSPFENSSRAEWVNEHFKKDQQLTRGYQGYAFYFNGLYQDMALLYAARGDVKQSLQSIDTLIKYSDSYYQRDYATMLDNATNVTSVFFRSNHEDVLDAFVTGYCDRKKISGIEFYQRLLARAKPFQLPRNSSVQSVWPESNNLNLQYGEEKEISFFYEKFRSVIQPSSNVDERNFLMAITYKDEGITLAHHTEVVGRSYDHEKVWQAFDASMGFYNKVSERYLNETIERVTSSAADLIASPRSSLYLFPDVIASFAPLGPRDFHWNYLSASFLDYMIDKNIFGKYYDKPQSLKYIEDWLTDYHYFDGGGPIFVRNHANIEVLIKLQTALEKQDAGSKVDLNLLYLYLGYYAFESGDQEVALSHYSKIRTENLSNIFRYKIIPGYIQAHSFLLIGKAYTCFKQNNKEQEAQRILSFFKKPANRSSLYAFAARELSEKKLTANQIQPLLDSAQAEMLRVENLNSAQPNRYRLAVSLVTNNPSGQSVQTASGIIKNQPLKFEALQRIARALSYGEELFKATEIVPGNISDADQLAFLWNILLGYGDSQPIAIEWKIFEDNHRWNAQTQTLNYVDETD